MATAPEGVKVYANIDRLFRRGEIVILCKAALAKEGPLNTRELSRRVVQAKGFREDDNELRKAVAARIVQALTLQWKRGKIGSPEKRGGVRLWKAVRPC